MIAAYFTHVQSCDVTRVQSATQWTASVQTSHQDVTQYRGRLFTGRHVTSRQDVTCRSYRGQGASRHVTSRHVRTSQAPPWTRRPRRHVTSRHVTSRQDVTGAAVDKEAVTSRHVLSGHHRRRRGQGGRHVTSRHVRTSQAPPWTRRPSRHVTSRHVTTSGAPRADHARCNRPTFRLTWHTNHWKNTAFRDVSNISRACIFFLLTFWLLHLLSTDLTTLLLSYASAFQLSILSEVSI